MLTGHSPRISEHFTPFYSALAIAWPLDPAWARAVPLNSQDFDFNQLFSDPLNLAIIGALVFSFVIGAYVVLRKSPNLADAQRAKEEYLRSLPGNAQGYKAVFYEDNVQGLFMGAGDLYNHRIIVELCHKDPARTKTLFRNEETPSMTRAIQQKKRIRAMKLWIKEARDKGLPAVYTTQRGVYQLDEEHFAQMAEDPDGFIKKLQSHILIRKPLRTP